MTQWLCDLFTVIQQNSRSLEQLNTCSQDLAFFSFSINPLLFIHFALQTQNLLIPAAPFRGR